MELSTQTKALEALRDMAAASPPATERPAHPEPIAPTGQDARLGRPPAAEETEQISWMRAETAGDPGPWRQQAVLGRGRGRWDSDSLRDIVRDYAL